MADNSDINIVSVEKIIAVNMDGDNILVKENTDIHRAVNDMISDNVTEGVMNIDPNGSVDADISMVSDNSLVAGTQKSVDKVADAGVDVIPINKLSQEMISNSTDDTLKLVISHVSSFQTVNEAENLAFPQQTHDNCDVNINHVDQQCGAVRDITKLEHNKLMSTLSDDLHHSDSSKAQNTVNITSLITSKDCSSLCLFSPATYKFMEKEITPSSNTVAEVGTTSKNNEAPQVVYVDLDVSNESSSKHDEEHYYNLKIREHTASNVLKSVTDLSLVSMDTDTSHQNIIKSEVHTQAEPLNILSEGQENGTPIEKPLCDFKSKSCVDQMRINEKNDIVSDNCNGSQVLSNVHFENNAEMNMVNKSDKGGADEFGTDEIMILDVRSLSDLDVEYVSHVKDFKTTSEEYSSVTVISNFEQLPVSNVEHLPVISNVEHLPVISNVEHLPVISDVEHLPVISDVEHLPVISNVEHLPVISNVEHLPVISNVEHLPAISDVEHLPVISDVEHLPVISDVEHLPVISDVEHLPAISDVEHLPVISDVEHLPVISNVEHLPVISNVEHLPAISDVEHLPVISDVEHLPVISDVEHLPAISDVEHLPVISDVEHLLVISDVVSLNTNDSYSLSTSSELCVSLQEQPSPISSEMQTSAKLLTYTESSKSVDNINSSGKNTELVQNTEVQTSIRQTASQENSEQSRSSPANSDSLSVISGTILMKNVRIKEEPADDGQYVRSNAEAPLICQAPNVSKSHVQPTAKTNIVMLSAGLPSATNIRKQHTVRMPASQTVRVTAVVPAGTALCPQGVPSAVAPTLCIFPTMNNITTINSVKTVTSTNGNFSSILDDVDNGKEANKNGTFTAIIRTAPPPKKMLILPKEDSLHSVISIKTVGVQKITEMIARKNPIPTYKPAAIPLSLKNGKNLKTYSCYECGDQFHFETSYKIHFSRHSMNLSYKCEKCGKLEFTNKCQLLSHLRSHMNIEKTQAVPIHIKSDSIEIKTLYNDIAASGKYFQWYDEKDKCNVPAVSKENCSITKDAISQSTENANVLTCSECNLVFGSANERKDHFQPCQGLVHYCDVCAVYTRSSCSLKAHKRIHDLCQESVSKNYNFKDATLQSLLMKLICPECGLLFPTADVADKLIAAHIENFFLHLKTRCFHLSRFASFKCPKCSTVFNSLNRMRRHICVTLNHYYKCGLCPMALKSVKSFEQHFNLKHKKQENVTDSSHVPVKIIYRCHVCDTLIDDKSFLVSHNEKHIGDISINPLFFFHCLQCSQLFEEKSKLDQHFQLMHRSVKRHWSCAHCRWTQLGNMFKFVSHTLNYHTHKDSCEKVIFCDACGLVCLNTKVLQTHDCLYKSNGFQIMGDKEAMKTKESVAGQHVVKTKEDKFEPISIPNHLSPLCRVCGKEFYSHDMRASHLKGHHTDKEYICVSCDSMSFKSYHDFRSHEILCTEMRKVPGPKFEDLPKDNSVIVSTRKSPKKRKHTDVTEIPYCCEKCSETFSRKSKFDEHVKSEHGIHPCHLCGLMHESQSSLKRHLLLDHEGKMFLYYCGVCKNRKLDKSFTARAKLEKHLRTKHRMKTIDESKIITKLPGLPETSKELTPEILKRKFADEANSPDSVHPVKKLRVDGEQLLKCAKCLYMCENRSTFQEHIAEHKTPNTCQCFECGLCFAVLPSIRMHLFMVHKIRDFDSYMEENNIEVPSNQDTDTSDDIEREPIQDEIFEESEEEIGNPLECKVCYKEFDHVTSLHSHMRIHGMAFIKKSRRRGHTSPTKQAMPVGIETPGERKAGLVMKIKKFKTVSPFKEKTTRKTLHCEVNGIVDHALKLGSSNADLNNAEINKSNRSGVIENNKPDLIKD